MEIKSKAGYPAGELSNFSPHRFTFRGVVCHSMEGFLQSLKTKNPKMQVHICTLVGAAAKAKGFNKNWQEHGLYWQGEKLDRFSDEYQKFLDEAFDALAKNTSFQRALLATGNAVLKHSIGKTKKQDTVLTQQEFTSRLEKIRSRLQAAGVTHDQPVNNGVIVHYVRGGKNKRRRR